MLLVLEFGRCDENEAFIARRIKRRKHEPLVASRTNIPYLAEAWSIFWGAHFASPFSYSFREGS